MAVDSKHPLYAQHLTDWLLMRDAYDGERAVKERRTAYLKPTAGMVEDGMQDGMEGQAAYDSYLSRARFPDFVREAVDGLLGVMHGKPPKIELPKAMEPMRERATLRGESLEMLLRRINEEQMVVGRVGLLADVVTGTAVAEARPYLSTYRAETIGNWDDIAGAVFAPRNFNMVALDESRYERTKGEFEWTLKRRYRVMVLGDLDGDAPGSYQVGEFTEETGLDFDPARMITPQIGGRPLDRIPFVIANTKDVVSDPDVPPMLGLGHLAFAVFRGEADYRHALYMIGNDTLVLIGSRLNENKPVRVGSSATIELTTGSDAKYIGVSGQGLTEMRESLHSDYQRGAEKGASLLDSGGKSAESGEALRIRVSARTSAVKQIAITGAFALQDVLRSVAAWMGLNEEAVVVTPNLDFIDDRMSGKELSEIMVAKRTGAPWSLESIHQRMVQQGLTEKTLEEELAAIEDEPDLGMPTANPNGPVAGDPDAPPPPGGQPPGQPGQPPARGQRGSQAA